MKAKKYPELIWSQGWGSEAFAHFNYNSEYFGRGLRESPDKVFSDGRIPYAAFACNFIGTRRYCRSPRLSRKAFHYLASVRFRFNLVIMEGDYSWPYMESYSAPAFGRRLKWNVGHDAIDPTFYRLLELENLNKIFVQNRNLTPELEEAYGPRVRHLPIGLDFHTMMRRSKKTLPEVERRLQAVHESARHTDWSVFVSDFAATNPHRAAFLDSLRGNPLCTSYDRLDYAEYFSVMSRHRFCLSLAGGGYDTHRTWEALVLGCIVIQESTPIDPLFEGFAVALISRPEEITEDNLRKWERELAPLVKNRTKLYRTHWIDEFSKP